MPGKRKRVASRQAQLAGKKRRDRSKMRRHTPIPESTRSEATSTLDSTSDGDMSLDTKSRNINRPASSTQHPFRRTRSSSLSADPLPVYPYLKSELRYIGVIAVIMAIILGIFTMILG